MMYHCMTVSDMVYHVQNKYPGIPDDVITETVKMMIEENIIRVYATINNVDLYSHSKNPNLVQKIWTYIIQMNYSATYNDVMDAFGMTSQQDIAKAIGIMVAKNIIVKNGDSIKLSAIEQKNILHNDTTLKFLLK